MSTKQALLAKRDELNQKLSTREGIEVERTSDALDEVQRTAEREFIISSLDRDWQTLKLVNAAIQRLEDGRYGVCERCEEDINPKRLKAIPWTRFCVTCQELYDARQRQRSTDEFGLSDAA